jgi:hypothetical protein
MDIETVKSVCLGLSYFFFGFSTACFTIAVYMKRLEKQHEEGCPVKEE